jgi:hypothetical protein
MVTQAFFPWFEVCVTGLSGSGIVGIVVQGFSGLASAPSPSLVLFAQTQAVSVDGTNVTDTSVIGTGTGSATIPPLFLNPGTTLFVRVMGVHSASVGAPTVDWKVNLGGTTILDTGAITTSLVTNQTFNIDAIITCYSTGPVGQIFAQGGYTEAGQFLAGMPTTTTTTIDTTVAQALTVTLAWGGTGLGTQDVATATNLVIFL